MAGACVDSQAKCVGCEDCVNGACVDNQAKCFGCEDCVNGVCEDNQAKCIGCEACVNGVCEPSSLKCGKCETCHSSGECIKDVPNCCASDEQCPPGKKCVDNVCVKNSDGIPTVSQWGIAVLTLLLLVGGKIYFGRRLAATDQRRS